MITLAKPIRQILAVLILGALVAAIFLTVIFPVISALQERTEQLSTNARLLSRYQWLAQNGPKIDEMLSAWKTDPTTQLVYNGLSSNQASIQLQNDIAAAVSASRVTLVRSRILPVEEGASFNRIGLNLELNTDMNELGVFLERLQSIPRLKRFDNVIIRSADGESWQQNMTPPRLYIEFDVHAFSSNGGVQ